MFDVSVVIPTYNHDAFIIDAITSVLEQSYPINEIIVVDDGSFDNTSFLLDKFGSDIIVIKQKNQGVAIARNAGARVCKSTLLAFLDSDDIWNPQKIEKQIRVYSKNPAVGLVHCGVVDVDEHGNLLRTRLDGLEGSVATEMLLFRRSVILGGGSGVVIPRNIFENVNGFDPKMSTSADWDLYFRIAAKWPVSYTPEPLLKYRVHSGNMHRNVEIMKNDMLNAYNKIFHNSHSPMQHMYRPAYARLHRMLAGSYYKSKSFFRFFFHVLSCIWNDSMAIAEHYRSADQFDSNVSYH